MMDFSDITYTLKTIMNLEPINLDKMDRFLKNNNQPKLLENK